MPASNPLTRMLAELAVPQGRVLYVHSSMDWLNRAGIGVGDALDALIDWTVASGGTLVLPAFPFRGSHEAYLRGRPIFDVRRSPARVGLLNETLRRRPGVLRSLDPDLSVVALGTHAETIVGTGFTGLGVSFNYMNMIHVLDSRYRARYPFEIYSRAIYTAHSIDAAGHRHAVTKHAILNALQTHIKPSQIVHLLRPPRDVFRRTKIGDTDFFVWDLPRWERLCVAHIEQMLDTGGIPCWLTEVATHCGHHAASVPANEM
jgi:hypothetical protein